MLLKMRFFCSRFSKQTCFFKKSVFLLCHCKQLLALDYYKIFDTTGFKAREGVLVISNTLFQMVNKKKKSKKG